LVRTSRSPRRRAWRATRAAASRVKTLDRADLGERDRPKVGDEPERSAVEVAARRYAAVGQHHRVVDRRGELAFGDGADVIERVARCAVYRRGATDAVGVLDARVVGRVAGDDR